MTDRNENEVVTIAMASFVPPMRTLRDRLAADGPFDAVTLAGKSDRWPEEIALGARNKRWDLHFKCDSNEVCRLSLGDRTRLAPRARPKAGFFFVGLLRGASVGPLCEAIPSIVQRLSEFLRSPVQQDLDEVRRGEVRAAFEEHTIALHNSSLMPLSGFDEQRVAALADQFMIDNRDIFSHPNSEVRTIHRADEVRDWLLARPDSAPAGPLEHKLLRYCVFRTVQSLCNRAHFEEAYFRSK